MKIPSVTPCFLWYKQTPSPAAINPFALATNSNCTGVTCMTNKYIALNKNSVPTNWVESICIMITYLLTRTHFLNSSIHRLLNFEQTNTLIIKMSVCHCPHIQHQCECLAHDHRDNCEFLIVWRGQLDDRGDIPILLHSENRQSVLSSDRALMTILNISSSIFTMTNSLFFFRGVDGMFRGVNCLTWPGVGSAWPGINLASASANYSAWHSVKPTWAGAHSAWPCVNSVSPGIHSALPIIN